MRRRFRRRMQCQAFAPFFAAAPARTGSRPVPSVRHAAAALPGAVRGRSGMSLVQVPAARIDRKDGNGRAGTLSAKLSGKVKRISKHAAGRSSGISNDLSNRSFERGACRRGRRSKEPAPWKPGRATRPGVKLPGVREQPVTERFRRVSGRTIPPGPWKRSIRSISGGKRRI